MLLALFSPALQAQDLPQTETVAPSLPNIPVFRSTTRNVLLDVVVTDSNGHPVRSLSQQDFTVKEDGVEQRAHLIESPRPAATKLTKTGTASGAGAQTAAGRSATPSASSRMRTLLLLDEVNVKFLDLAFARSRIDVFLASPVSADQVIGIMAIVGNKLVLVHDFTTDREELRKALKALPAALPGTADAAVDEYTDYENFNNAVSALETIGRSLQGSPVRTNCLWITSGFMTMAKLQNSSDVETNFDLLMKNTANLYLGARMSIYTIDPHGIQYESSLPNHDAQPRRVPPGGTVFDIDNGTEVANQTLNMTSNSAVVNGILNQLDERTGGRGYGNQNDIDLLISEAIDDASSSYLLAYAPRDHNFHGEYRRIRVELKQPGLHARTRDGYIASPDQPQGRPPETVRKELQFALESPLPYTELHAQATLDRTGSRPTVHLRLDPENVEWTPEIDGHGGEVTQIVAVAAYSSRGKPLFNHEYRVNTRRPDTNSKTSLDYNLPVTPPPDTARMRVAVLDLRGTHLGTAEVEMASPAKP